MENETSILEPVNANIDGIATENRPRTNEILLSKYSNYRTFEEFLEIVMKRKYPYFEWRNRVYKVSRDKNGVATPYRLNDIIAKDDEVKVIKTIKAIPQ